MVEPEYTCSAGVEPPSLVLPSYTYLLPDHCANNVKLAVWPCVYGNEMAEPPLDAANQPLNVYPLLVGDPGEEAIEPPVVVDPLLIALPPWEL